MIRRGVVAGCAAAILLLSACTGNGTEAEPDSGVTTTRAEQIPDNTEPATTLPVDTTEVSVATTQSATTETTLPEAVLSDLLGFIEVSARIGLAEEADVVALAVDRETLAELPVGTIDDSPAWCTGADEFLFEDNELVPMYVVRIGEPAIDATLAGAEWFELRATDVSLGDGVARATIELMVNGSRYEVVDGEMDLGETQTGGTFRGITSDNEIVEGAFLCG